MRRQRATSFGTITQPAWGRVDLQEPDPEPEIESTVVDDVDPDEVWDPRRLNPNGVF